MLNNSVVENQIYLKVNEIAQITGKSARTLQDRCVKNKYTCRLVNGNGGKQYEIQISTLERELQEKILEHFNTNLLAGNKVSEYSLFNDSARFSLDLTDQNNCYYAGRDILSFGEYSTITPISLDLTKQPEVEAPVNSSLVVSSGRNEGASSVAISSKNNLVPFSLAKPVKNVIPGKAKKIALAKVDLLNHWQAYRNNEKKSKKVLDNEFIEIYNSKALSNALYNIIGKISLKTLYRWQKDFNENGQSYRALVPSYNYSSDLNFNTKMSAIEIEKFTYLMLNKNKIKVGRAYEIVGALLSEIGIERQASLSSYKRLWDYYKKMYNPQVTFAREGLKATKDKALPSLRRDVSVLEVGDVIIADGHTLDFELINPFTGQPKRLTMIAFQDWASGDLLGWEIMPTENVQAIASAFRNSLIRLGKTPKVVYMDNGRAFRAKYFKGCENLKTAGICGIYQDLGITVKHATPYNGRAKVIERFFKEFTESFAITQDYYVGNNIDNKPAYMHRNEKFHKSLKNGEVPTVEDFKFQFENWLEKIYRKRKHRDGEMTIGEFFERGRGSGIDVSALDDLMMSSEIRKVGRNGINFLNELYWNDALINYKERVVIKYSFFNINEIKVYSIKGDFICTAVPSERVHAMVCLGDAQDLATFEHAKRAQEKLIKDTLAPAKEYLKACNTPAKKKARQIREKATRQKQIPKFDFTSCYSQMDFPVTEQKKYNII